MKKNYICAVLVVIFCGITAMDALGQEAKEGKNLVKFNMLTLFGGKYSVEYERLLTNRIAVGTAVSFRPEKGLPFADRVREYVDGDEMDLILNDLTTSNFSITPEVRFYTSSRGPFRGFYIAPYAKYASYEMAMPFEFEVDAEDEFGYERKETIPLNGSIRSFTGGLSFGFNFKLVDNVHLDWRIIGPGYGSSKGDISGTMGLNADEQAALREGLNELEVELEDLPVPLTIEHEVDGNGANIRIVKSPWASIRSGLSISYRF